MIKTSGYAAFDHTGPLGPFQFERRDPGPADVQIDIQFCGVCHSDLHTVKSEWGRTTYPCVPGHEIVGRVAKVGREVKKFKEGDLAGVGCLVDSDRTCPECEAGLEQYCNNMVLTYNSPDKHLPGKPTYGGYSTTVVVDQRFVLHMSEKLNAAGAAPLLCAGITTYSPMRHWKVQRGQTVGVVGLGGLGHMGLKFAHAFGARTVLFTTSPDKAADATRLGAEDVVVSKDPDAMAKQAGRFDFILNTVSAPHNLDPFVGALKRDGTMVLIGVPATPHPSPGVFGLVFKRRSIAGSLIGGLPETQEMLDFCAERGITADVEVIPMQRINEAYDRMLKSDVKYRFVIDVASLRR
ncbi:MAG TPA: NAD(P)-dependent alcohol dehydrogenase [Gemmataceae bacterium]|nr:NAD(P)-dependent alcohol dehydrogenase [Gemmataceae bacterium]